MNKYDPDVLLRIWSYSIERLQRASHSMDQARWRRACHEARELHALMTAPVITEWENAA